MKLLPDNWEKILKTNDHYNSLVNCVLTKYEGILESELFFFPEYTDHGVKHLRNVLHFAQCFIHTNSYDIDVDKKGLGYKSLTTLILSCLLHDLGMHLTYDGFKCLLSNPVYQNTHSYRQKAWGLLWDEYLQDARRWSDQYKQQVFGESIEIDGLPESKGIINQYHRMLCGEFLRRNHHLLAYDIAEIGYPINEDNLTPYLDSDLEYDSQLTSIIALIAFSHGIGLWEAVDLLEEKYDREQVKSYNGIKTPFIMALLRISDFFDISSDRASKTFFNTNKILSPLSNKEWLRHHCIEHIDMDSAADPELIYIGLNCPQNSEIYLCIQELIKSIQYEMDVSWAVIGRYYGRTNEQLKLSFRRIDSNLRRVIESKNCNYVAERINLDINRDTLDLLVGPLYQYKPTFGVRELIQNAVDACNEKRQKTIQKSTGQYNPEVVIEIKVDRDGNGEFCIRDNGIGMDYKVIKNYFLVVGATYRKSKEWEEAYTFTGNSTVARNGRFGVGVLAAFLLGDTISVKTKKYLDKYYYKFSFDTKMVQVEVSKEETDSLEESGTEIRIPISSPVVKYLEEQYSSDELSLEEDINWADWYYGHLPKLMIHVPDYWERRKYQYYIDITGKPNGGNWKQLKSSDFEKIEYRFGNEDYNILFYNGILIPGYYLNDDCCLWDIHKPAISIIDNSARLMFDLQRTKVISLPFNQLLLEDIYADIFSKLISSQPILDFYQNKDYFQPDRIEFIHAALARSYSTDRINKNFIFHKDGFIISHRYFLRRLRIDKIWIVKINRLTIQFPKNILNQYVLFIDEKHSYNKNKFISTGFEMKPLIIFKRAKKDSRNPRIAEKWEYTITEPIEITEEMKEWVKTIPNDINEFGYYECIIRRNKDEYIELNYFEKLLDSYLRNYPIIPYSFKDRQSRLPEAYNFLKGSKYITAFNSSLTEYNSYDEEYDEDYDWNEYERRDGWDPDFFTFI